MAISLLVLFGSRARGDAEDSSDTDLLLATEEPGISHITEGTLSLSFYGEAELKARAKHGDLFICHVIREGRLLGGDASLFEEIRSSFRLRGNYRDEVVKASDLGRFLIHFGSRLGNDQLVNRRLAWVARTILIARTAESGAPLFAPRALASWSGVPEVEALVSGRYSDRPNARSLATLRELLERWGEPPQLPKQSSINSYRKHFAATENAVALRVFDRRSSASKDGMYI